MGNRSIPLSLKRGAWLALAGLIALSICLLGLALFIKDSLAIGYACVIFLSALLALSLSIIDGKSRKGCLFAWDDTHLWLTREGNEVWRAAWTEIAECKSRNSRPFAYLILLKNGTVLELPCRPFGCHPLEMILRAAGIEMSGTGGSLSLGKLKNRTPRWLLKNHMRYGAKPNPEGKPVVFRALQDRTLRGVRIYQLVFYAFAVLYSFALFAGLAIVFVLETTRRISPGNGMDLLDISVFSLLFLGTAAFFIRAFVLAIASRMTNNLGLRFDREKVYIVDGGKATLAQIEPKSIGLLSEYLVVRAGEKRYWFSLLMAQE